jgi:hypothetical protein
MSGSGFKTFVDGDVLTAAEVNGYLMKQAVVYYTTTTARDLDTPFEGKVVYIAASNEMQFYTGTTWIRLQDAQIYNNKGDISVGTGADTFSRFTLGNNEERLVVDTSTSNGLKYVADTTNYAVAAKGDLLVGTAADTLAALTVGTDGHVLTADANETSGVKWAAVAAGGKMLQVVSTTLDTTASINTESDTADRYVDVSGLSASITPATTGSKILVLVNIHGTTWTGTNSFQTFGARVLRGATVVGAGSASSPRAEVGMGLYLPTADSNSIAPLFQQFVDSPNTTSATTYQVQVTNLASGSAPVTVYVNRTHNDSSTQTTPRPSSTITLIEIGA